VGTMAGPAACSSTEGKAFPKGSWGRGGAPLGPGKAGPPKLKEAGGGGARDPNGLPIPACPPPRADSPSCCQAVPAVHVSPACSPRGPMPSLLRCTPCLPRGFLGRVGLLGLGFWGASRKRGRLQREACQERGSSGLPPLQRPSPCHWLPGARRVVPCLENPPRPLGFVHPYLTHPFLRLPYLVSHPCPEHSRLVHPCLTLGLHPPQALSRTLKPGRMAQRGHSQRLWRGSQRRRCRAWDPLQGRQGAWGPGRERREVP